MPTQTDTIVIEQSLPLVRLDAFLRTKFPALSRGAIQRLLNEGAILVDGKRVKPTHRPGAGETVVITWPDAKIAEAKPENIPLAVLWEDSDLLVLNKPAGLVVHPAAGHEEHTLVNALLHHCEGSLSGIGGVARPGIVHRLDRETSGCLVVAKNDEAHLSLTNQFTERTVEKIYTTIVCGRLIQKQGRIQASIGRNPADRKKMGVVEDHGRDALTSFVLREAFEKASWLDVQIHTGRTHQIRVHFSHLGYPVFGDHTYGKRATLRLVDSTGIIPGRQMLHAKSIRFQHPRTKEEMKFESPLPPDFESVLESLRRIHRVAADVNPL